MAMANAASGQPVKTGTLAAVTLGPLGIARLMGSPTGIKWLTKGFKTRLTSPEAAGIAVKILKLQQGSDSVAPIMNYIKGKTVNKEELEEKLVEEPVAISP